jgi:hypothetical protein
MHWIHWKKARNAPHVEATLLSIDDEGFVLAMAYGGELRWWHHEMPRLRQALEVPGARIQAVPTFHALRVNDHWFNCSRGPSTVACRFEQPRR